MTAIEYLTFQNVGPDAQVEEAVLRDHEVEIDRFLIAHMDALLAAANKGTVPTAVFLDDVAESLFRDARDSDCEAFLEAATGMSTQLIKAMDNRSKEGLLVIFRTSGPKGNLAVLKLEVASQYAATLQRVGEGQENLLAVKDVLDAPGRLQKGLLYADPRDASSIVAIDKRSAITANYFLRAFSIVLNAQPAEGNLALVQAVFAVDSIRDTNVLSQVFPVLPQLTEGDKCSVLDQLQEAVPEVAEISHEIEANLADCRRPMST